MKKAVRNFAAVTDEITPLEEENSRISYEAALESIVLLENDGTLPLSVGKIALYGAGADKTIKGGTGSGEVMERHVVSIMEGLENIGFTVTTKSWICAYEKKYKEGEKDYASGFVRKLMKQDIMNVMAETYRHPFGQPITQEDMDASDTDTCIYVVARQAGEGKDRRLNCFEYSLAEEEKDAIAMCAAHYEKMILVINVGAVFDMSFMEEIPGINAVLYYGQQGMRGGDALAALLAGRASPSAKTVDTWPEKYEDIPFAMDYSYLNGNLEEAYYREGIYVGYRYFDTFHVKPRYPFGYGLSYTSFSVKTGLVTTDGGKIALPVTMTNIGDAYSGKEVVQLYVSCPHNEYGGEYQKLAAFGKTRELAPGESETLTLRFDMRDLAFYREEDSSFVLSEGDYILRCGTSSRDTAPAAIIVLDREAVTEQCIPVCKSVRPLWELEPLLPKKYLSNEKLNHQRESDRNQIVRISAKDIQTKTHRYGAPEAYTSHQVDEILNSFSDEELCEVVTGDGLIGGSPVGGGTKVFEAPGSAGFTTGRLAEKGLPNICLADGPAGLRLQRTSAVLASGKLKGVEPMLSGLNYLPGIVKKAILGNPKKVPRVYQFTTSFPTALSLAQSWNTDLAECVGRAVGNEMERYGVTCWLAPGMNIHRNPLCGRNFEYYSEDPLLSGKMAAAVSRGVQSRKGCYVTIKHFCCNNQEDNRGNVDVRISERALREIYMKGFQIAVREGTPRAVMSSYGKINGIYTNNNYNLLTNVLRNEWGFDGFVMTDWFATGGGRGSHTAAIEAGNDLIMPGGRSALKELKRQLKKGELDAVSLKRCAANVVRAVTDSRIYTTMYSDG